MIGLTVASLALPCWVLLLVGVPVLMTLSQAGVVEPVLSVGTIAINAEDMVTVVVALRTAAYVLLSRRRVRLPTAPLAFVGVMIGSTLAVFLQQQGTGITEQSTALLRFIAQASLLVLFAYSLRTVRQLEASCDVWRLLGYLVAGSVYLDIILFALGLPLGEVQVSADGARYFGPLGDQVGFLLPLFIYRDLIARRLVGAAFCLLALLLTGTRGALISLAVGLLIFVWPYRHRQTWRRNAAIALTLVVMMGVALWFDPGGMVTRFVNPQVFARGLGGRAASIEMALRMFFDHPLLGLGFGGFRLSLPQYYSREEVYGTFNQLSQVATDAGIAGVATFCWMIVALLKHFNVSREHVTGTPRELLHASYIWLVGLAIGNQSTAWLVPGSMISTALWLLIATACVAAQVRTMPARSSRESPVTEPPRSPKAFDRFRPAASVASSGWGLRPGG